jgi:hypothetical protein
MDETIGAVEGLWVPIARLFNFTAHVLTAVRPDPNHPSVADKAVEQSARFPVQGAPTRQWRAWSAAA